jgi:methylmalonyl-CoA mutase N-terminal domain/subunit
VKAAAETNKQRWERETVEPTLERNPERAPSFTTISGHPIDRLYTSEDLEGVNYRRDLGDPGDYPYTRGIHASG